MRNLICTVLLCGMLLAFGSNMAQASTLVNTPYAMAGWQGSQLYVSILGDTLDATVEYAVFAPGSGFQDFLNEPTSPIDYTNPAPGEYIYAYQIVDVALTSGDINVFSVGLDSNEVAGSTGVTYIPIATDYGTYSPQPSTNSVDPSPTGGPGVSSSSTWNFAPALLQEEVSGILYYSSPHPPEMGLSTVSAGGMAGQFLLSSMPNPGVPEPTSMSLCVIAGLGLLARRKR